MFQDSSNIQELDANTTPEHDNYLKMRKRRRSTVSNIWQLKTVLKEEVDDDNEFISKMIEEEEKTRKEGLYDTHM